MTTLLEKRMNHRQWGTANIMSKARLKRGKYENFTYREFSCTDLLAACEETASNVPETEIDLYCAESSLDDDWDQEESSSPKKLKRENTETPEACFLPQEANMRPVPPNSPIYPQTIPQENKNPFVSYLLQIWSEQKFNSPRINTRQHEAEASVMFDNTPLVLEDPAVSSMLCVDDRVPECEDTDYHVVPSFENPSISRDIQDGDNDDDFDWQRSRVLNSCSSSDHIVPVRFLEE